MAVHITTPQQLQDMSLDLAEDYILDNDLDMTAFAFTRVGTLSVPFTGTFDGQGFTISNLTLNLNTNSLTEGVGMFGHISGGSIQNVTLENCTLNIDITTNEASRVGCLAGQLTNSPLSNCHVLNSSIIVTKATTTNSGVSNCGLLVGRVATSAIDIANVSGDVTITLNASLVPVADLSAIGGAIGLYQGDPTTRSVSRITSNVTINLTGHDVTKTRFDRVGGLLGSAGTNFNISCSSCTATIILSTGAVTAVGGFMGNLASSNTANALLSFCHATSTITMTSCAMALSSSIAGLGGFIGDVAFNGTINKCRCTTNIDYAGSGTASSSAGVGGFIGKIYSLVAVNVTNCFCAGDLDLVVTSEMRRVGGFIGAHIQANSVAFNIQNCYSNIDLLVSAGSANISMVGGFMGGWINNGVAAISNCYPVGTITLTTSGTKSARGGFIGIIFDTAAAPFIIDECSWLTSLETNAIGEHDSLNVPIATLTADGYGTEEATASDFYTDDHPVYTDWDFIDDWRENGSNYPILYISTVECVPAVRGISLNVCPYVRGGQVRKMVDTIDGLDHLEGETIKVQMDGDVPRNAAGRKVTNGFEVSGGEITLPKKAAVIHAGLGYEGTLTLLKSNEGSQLGTGQMKMRRVFLGILRLYRTMGLKIGIDEEHLQQLFDDQQISDLQAEGKLLFTGDQDKLPDTYHTKENEVIIRQDEPLPAYILAAVTRSEVEEGV